MLTRQEFGKHCRETFLERTCTHSNVLRLGWPKEKELQTLRMKAEMGMSVWNKSQAEK